MALPLVFAAALLVSMTQNPTQQGPSDRERAGLHGPVRVCVEERMGPAVDSKAWNLSSTTEYDADGHLLVLRYKNPDGSLSETTYLRDSHGRLLRMVGTFPTGNSETTYTYDDSGRILKTDSTSSNAAPAETTYAYDSSGRLVSEATTDEFASQSEYRYDEHSQKTKIMHVPPRRSDHAVSIGNSLLEAAEVGAFSPADGGTITILYDQNDRATEAQVRNLQGEVFSRIVRTYDSAGHVVDEKQVMENPQLIIPVDLRKQILAESGATAAELSEQLKSVFGGNAGTGITNKYDAQGHLVETRMQILGTQQINTFNEHGDQISEVNIRPDPIQPEAGSKPAVPNRSETRIEYRYDSHGNWIEKSTTWRDADGTPKTGDVAHRTITYYAQ